MTAPAPDKTLDELTLGNSLKLEDLVDRDALGEMLAGFFQLFRVPLRVFSDGQLLADVSDEQRLYAYLSGLKRSRIAVQDVVTAVKAINPGHGGVVNHRCVTGAMYRIVAVSYDGRAIGRLIIGPFVPADVTELPAALLALDPEIDRARASALFSDMPRLTDAAIGNMARHLLSTLDLILFSGHKALLTTNMHLAAVKQSYRDLEDKNVKLQQAYERLKELDRLKSNFLATVSHELRTPLTSIIGYSEMLVEGIAGDLSDEQRDFVRTIYEKGEQLLQLIKGLLDLSKLESGTMSMHKDYVAVEPLVRDVTQTVAPTARKKGIEIVAEVEEALPELWADAARLRQVLLNLTDNAVKFTPSGGRVTVSARLSSMQTDDDGAGLVLLARRSAVEFRVADTGIGIPSAEREKVFDAFYQVDSSSTREQGGTGLGLSIVKRLVSAHDGTAHAEENQPQGAAFVIRIPCRRATVA